MNYGKKSVFKDIYYHPYRDLHYNFGRNVKDDESYVQRLGLLKKLKIHTGCVNTICWNSTGEYILSGSDDQHLVITNGHNYKVQTRYATSHNANIFSAKFLPNTNDEQIVSCAGDGTIVHTDLKSPQDTYNNQFTCHNGTTYEVVTSPLSPSTFFSCGEDGTVRLFDLRTKTSCTKQKCKDDIIVELKRAVTALAINPSFPNHIAIGGADSTVRLYDHRYLSNKEEDYLNVKPFCNFNAPTLEERHYRITSLCYSEDGNDMLVSYSSDYLYLFNIKQKQMTELKKQHKSKWESLKSALAAKKARLQVPVRRLRLRGDWSDTGPNARPERDTTSTSQARPHLHDTLMQRMTVVLSRMINDPRTRAALSEGGEDSLDPEDASQRIVSGQSEANNNTTEEPPQGQSLVGVEPDDLEDGVQGEGEVGGADRVGSPMDVDAESPEGSNSAQAGTNPAPAHHLHSQLAVLRDLREGFIEHHGAEPSLSLRYSEQSTTTSTIRLRCNPTTGEQLPSAASPRDVTATGNASTNSSEADGRGIVEGMGGKEAAEGRQRAGVGVEDVVGEGLAEVEGVVRDVGQNESGFTQDETPRNVLSSSLYEPMSQPSTSSQPSSSMANSEVNSDVELDYDEVDDDSFLFKNESLFPETCPDEMSYDAFMEMKYSGHRNARTMIKEATFWGNDYVMSGSDCGHIFVWERKTGKLKMLLQGDQHVVNCLQPHPTLPLLATSGIDHDIKLWAPILEDPVFDTALAEDLIRRNAVMLEETRDTITVPAAFMIRMLTFLNQMPRVSTRSRNRRRDDTEHS